MQASRKSFLPYYDADWDNELQQAYKAGKRGLKANRQAGPVAPPTDTDFLRLPAPAPKAAEYFVRAGDALMRQGKLGVVHLSGGLATRFGQIKATHDVADFAGKIRTFLELKAAHVRWAAEKYGAAIAYALMNSPMTDPVVREYLQRNHCFGLPQDKVFVYVQSVLKRKIPRQEDLPAAVAKQDGEGEFFQTADASQELLQWSPAGHFDAVASLITSGTLGRLLSLGVEYLQISNIDNLAATLEPAILGLLAQSPEKILVEVAMKKPGDKGGVPVRWQEKGVVLLEEFALPEGFDGNSVRQFNTATYWMKIDALLTLFDMNRQDALKGSGDLLSQKVMTVRRRIPVYTAVKNVDIGDCVMPLVQDEQLLGDITRLYLEKTGRSPHYLLVNAEERFIPVKNKEDLIKEEPRIRAVLQDKLLLK